MSQRIWWAGFDARAPAPALEANPEYASGEWFAMTVQEDERGFLVGIDLAKGDALGF